MGIQVLGAEVQVQKIRLLLRGRGLGSIRVGTVDDLQGQEERIIFISTVLSKPETLPPLLGGKDADIHLGFWRNPKRFNVAVTRAKALLVVLGHPMVLVEASPRNGVSDNQNACQAHSRARAHLQRLYRTPAGATCCGFALPEGLTEEQARAPWHSS